MGGCLCSSSVSPAPGRGELESRSHGDPWWRRIRTAASSGSPQINAASCSGGKGGHICDTGSQVDGLLPILQGRQTTSQHGVFAWAIPSVCSSLTFLECFLQEVSQDCPQPQGPHSGICVPHHTQDHPDCNHLVVCLSPSQSCESREGKNRVCFSQHFVHQI